MRWTARCSACSILRSSRSAHSVFAVIIVVLALGMEDQLRLRREEEERLNLEREKMKSDRFLQSMSRIVDRYMVVNLDTGRYRYHELRVSINSIRPRTQYSEMVEIISKTLCRADRYGKRQALAAAYAGLSAQRAPETG